MSETEREARLRATRAMLDDLYKRTSESRGEMMRASRRNFTAEPERGMSRDGEAAAADARSLADRLVRGSSTGARETLGVQPAAARAKGRAPMSRFDRAAGMAGVETPAYSADAEERDQAVRDRLTKTRRGGVVDAQEYERARRAVDGPARKSGTDAQINREDALAREARQGAESRRRTAMAGGPSGKSGKGADTSRRAQVMRGRQARADAEYKRRAVAPQEARVQGDEFYPYRVRDDLAERRDAGLLSDEAYRRAVESMFVAGRDRVDVARDLQERRNAGLLEEAEYRRIMESLENAR